MISALHLQRYYKSYITQNTNVSYLVKNDACRNASYQYNGIRLKQK